MLYEIPGLMRLVTLLLAFLALPVWAQETFSISVETDKEVYAYGETIVVTIDVTNETQETQVVWGSSSCRAAYRIDRFDVTDYTLCTADSYPFPYPPGATRRWVWEADPAFFGVPRLEGDLHTVFGFHPILGIESSVDIEAPAFVGGFIDVLFSASLPPERLQPVRDSLRVEVIDRYEGNTSVSERWRIEGTRRDTAIARYENDSRFEYFYPYDEMFSPEGFFVTANEETPSGDRLHVEAGPNPFAGALTVTVTPPQTESVRVEVLDIRGRRVALLQDGVLAGEVSHPITWQPSRLGNGTYLVRVSSEHLTQTRRVTFRR